MQAAQKVSFTVGNQSGCQVCAARRLKSRWVGVVVRQEWLSVCVYRCGGERWFGGDMCLTVFVFLAPSLIGSVTLPRRDVKA